jgi:thiamine kinase-like enzyme
MQYKYNLSKGSSQHRIYKQQGTNMSYRIESATKEEWVARCFAAETRLALYEAAEHPKMLWVDPTGVDELNMYVGHASATMDYLNMDVAYIRKDIADARTTKLEDTLKEIMKGNSSSIDTFKVWELLHGES